jgi:hypothetical protein
MRVAGCGFRVAGCGFSALGQGGICEGLKKQSITQSRKAAKLMNFIVFPGVLASLREINSVQPADMAEGAHDE